LSFYPFLAALQAFYRGDAGCVAESVIPVTRATSRLSEVAKRLGCRETWHIPPGIHGGFAVFTPVGLLPSAIVGSDVVRMLEGASAMNDHFRKAPVGSNAVLDFAGISHLMQQRSRATRWILRVWAKALDSTARWYAGLREEMVDFQPCVSVEKGHGPSRDFETTQARRRPGRRDAWATNLVVELWRCDALPATPADAGSLASDYPTRRYWPDLLAEAIQESMLASRQNGCPTAAIRLARLNEYTLGQLLQMWMLATAVERCLLSELHQEGIAPGRR
jgi:glucose-6-phosphate isomerase